ncbi:Thiol-disulfide oxidoreductase ResA [bacterium HR15]|nr:Thiol-disulfide oxidoreductase ResA [bacterium HR15]
MVRWSIAVLALIGLLGFHGFLPGEPPTRGQAIPLTELRWHDLNGNAMRWSDLRGSKAIVILTLSSRCPAVPRYAPRLNRLYDIYSKRGVAFIGIYPEADENLDKVRDHALRMGFRFLIVLDGAPAIARALRATHVPQAFVLSPQGRVLYSGAIDSVIKREVAQHYYLRDALDAVLNGKPVKVARTEVIGCFLSLPEDQLTSAPRVTFAEHIAPILYENCTTCHRLGDIGPFPLQTYEDAKRWAKEIKFYTQNRQMPPWKPVPGWGEFREARRLTDEQIRLIAEWVDSGMPAGDLSRAPKPPKFDKGWYFGEPDLVLEMPEPYTLDGTGGDEYRYFVIPVELPEGVAMEAIDIQPGNREVVHHANVFVDLSGTARKLDAEDPAPGYARFGGGGFIPAMMLGGWVPGMRPMRLDPGYAVLLPRKFDLVLQIHYFKRGKRETDRTRVGLYFSRAKELKPVQLVVIGNTRFVIPPGEKHYEIRARWKTPPDRPVYALAIMAHMHLIARGCEVVAHTPDGRTIPLLKIDDYDFNWQQTYFYKQPIELPPGTLIDAVGWYDNSSDNPNNPSNPPREVRYGERTYDEMFYIFLAIHDPQAKGSYLIPASL